MTHTDLDDPFGSGETISTVVRPQPGGTRRLPVETTVGARPVPAPGEPENLSGALREMLGQGLNPLVRAASPLLLLAGRLRQSPAHADVAGLRRQVVDEIRRFEARARASGAAPEVVMAGRYVLCATVDEAVLSTPWGGHSEWAQQSLLVALHREAWGGQKFFEMLDRISAQADRHIDLIELQYLCLSVGFAGKYRVADRGAAQLADVQQSLYRRIRDQRGAPPSALSLRWQGRQDRRNPVLRYVPLWVFAAATATVLSLTFVVLYARLVTAASPVHAALARIGADVVAATAPAPAGPTLKQLLASEEARRAVLVEEAGGRTTVTLLAADLFASGSERLNPAARNTVHAIAQAVQQVPGRVMVVGHTDDQPIRSLRFQDNFALSRARAETVARLLRQEIEAPARVQANGMGATQPRYRPENSRENRSRNRRVEIVHVSGS
jgi:type VI secretion system protein ImpK